MNFGIDVTYHDDELECRYCEEYSAVTVTVDHYTRAAFWECPQDDCHETNEIDLSEEDYDG